MPRRKGAPPKPKIGKRYVHSNFELDVYNAMKAFVPKGASLEYETETLGYTVSMDYRPDFILSFEDGRKMYIECKGYFSYKDRVKMQSVKEAHPELDIRLVFMRNSPSCLGKGSKQKPSDWCEKYGFKYSIGVIPQDWME